MFRQVNIRDNDQEFKAVLWKNRREPLGEINNEYIKKVKRTTDIDTFDLEIPKWIIREGKNVFNPLYLKVQTRQQIIVETTVAGEKNKERFIINESSRKASKKTGMKSFKCYSFERILKDKRTSFEGKVIQLKKDDIHIAEGIMDKFTRETGWSVDYVDPKARTETMSMAETVNVDLFNNYSSENISDGGLIFEKDIRTSIGSEKPLYLSFEYINLNVFNGNELVIANSVPITNTITDALYDNITKVQAYHYSDTGNRYGIRYVFTLVDGTTTERTAVFANVINKRFICEKIRLIWETGDLIETENVKYINIESLDMDWYSALRDLESKFNSVFFFDSYNKSISVYSRRTLEGESNLSPYLLSYDNSVLDINVTEKTEMISCLKVMGKEGLSIISENIYGDDIVRDYSEYRRKGLMSDELSNALDRYEAFLTTKQQEWLTIKNNLLDETQKQIRLQSEISSLQERIKYMKNLLAAFIKEGNAEDQARLKLEIDSLEARFNECSALYTQYVIRIQGFNDEMLSISQSTKKDTAEDNNGRIFTELDLEELDDIEVVAVYEDEYYSSPFALINAAKKKLKEDIEPQIDFKINCANLCKVIQNSNGWNYVLKIWSLFNIKEVDLFDELDNKQDYQVRLIGYTYEPSKKEVSELLFTNKVDRVTSAKTLANINKKNNVSMDLLNSYRKIFDDAKLSNNFAKEILENGLDLSAYIAKGRGISNYVDFSEAGLFMYDQSNMDNCIYMGSSLICISQDGFKTSEVAISSSAIYAKLLVGSVILGEKLYITSENGQFYIGDMEENDGFGLSITDENGMERIFLGTELDSDNIKRAKLRLVSKDGRETVLNENGIISEVQFPDRDHVDSAAPYYSYLRISDKDNYYKECLLSIILRPFRVYSLGVEAGGELKSSGFTSMSGGGTTSGSGGGYYDNVTSAVENYYNTEADYVTGFDTPTTTPGFADKHFHNVDKNQLNHFHSSQININPHVHENPEHSHYTEITIDTTHNHEQRYGCIDLEGVENFPSNCSLYVNGIFIKGGINSNVEIDIKDYIVKDSLNEIKITSDTRGVIHTHLYKRSFISW